jgi:outer membrane protein insertion porin family
LLLALALGVLAGGARADPPPPPPPPVWSPERDRVPPAAPPSTPAPPARQAPPGRVPPPPPPPAWGDTQPARPAASPPARPAPARPDRPVAPPAAPRRPGTPVRGAPAEARPVIRRIVFDGNLLYATEMIKTRLRNKEGQRLDPVALDQDMKELYRYFKEIQVVKEPVAGGIVLHFVVSENPLVVRLDIRGAAEMEEEEIREMLRTKEGYPLSPYHLASDREDVVEAYRARGFPFVDVPDPWITTLASGGRRVTFAIVEGPEVTVDRIVFRGNVHLPRSDLVEVMLTSSANWIERIVGDDVFREDVLREDLVAIKQLYRREGFLDAEVALDDLRFSDDKSRVVISIAIVEHQPYTVGEIEFEIEREDPGKICCPTAEDLAVFTPEGLRGLFGLSPGERYSGKKADEGIERIRKEYFARSFLDAQVGAIEFRGRPRALVVDLTIRIVEGAKFRLARIDFVGNEFTRDRVLRRMVKTSPGGYVDRNQLDRGLQRMQRSQWFDRATMRIDDALGPDGDLIEGWKHATYELAEGSTGHFTFGVQLSTNGGFGATVQFRKQNFDIARWPSSFDDIDSGRAWTGAGQEFDILLIPSTEVSQFRVRFREPHLFGSDFAFETSLYKQFEFRRSYLVDRSGYRVSLSYPLFSSEDETQALVARVGWRHELDDIADVSFDAVPGAFLFDSPHELRGLQGSLSFATVDDFLEPRYETGTVLAAEVVGGSVGGDLDFWTINASHTQSWVVYVDDEGKKHRLSGRLLAGYGESFGSTPEIPPYERFFLGGNNMRGFAFRGLGPHVNGYPTGGEWYAAGTLQYEYPLVKNLFSVVAFVDSGTVAQSIHDVDAFDMRVSIGAGIRIAIPFLLGERPLALDFATALNAKPEDEEQLISFTLGRSF